MAHHLHQSIVFVGAPTRGRPDRANGAGAVTGGCPYGGTLMKYLG